jgi:hypothetical protein
MSLADPSGIAALLKPLHHAGCSRVGPGLPRGVGPYARDGTDLRTATLSKWDYIGRWFAFHHASQESRSIGICCCARE